MQETVYVVEFSEQFEKFKRDLAYHDLPTIDQDVAKWYIMSVFEKPHPMRALEITATELSSRDYLFSKEDYFDVPRKLRRNADKELRNYIHGVLMDLGRGMYQKLKEHGMFYHGRERYKITSRPLDDDTYIFKASRS